MRENEEIKNRILKRPCHLNCVSKDIQSNSTFKMQSQFRHFAFNECTTSKTCYLVNWEWDMCTSSELKKGH